MREKLVIAVIVWHWIALNSYSYTYYLTQHLPCAQPWKCMNCEVSYLIVIQSLASSTILKKAYVYHGLSWYIIVYQSEFEGGSLSRRFTEHRLKEQSMPPDPPVTNFCQTCRTLGTDIRQMFVFGDSGSLHHAPTNLLGRASLTSPTRFSFHEQCAVLVWNATGCRGMGTNW